MRPMSEKEIHDLQKEMKDLTKAVSDLREGMKPMIDVYVTFSRLGNWGVRLLKSLVLILTVVSLILGIIYALKKGHT